MSACKIVGPYLPVGDDEWRCVTHNVEAVLRDESIWRIRSVRREDFVCPMSEEAQQPRPAECCGVCPPIVGGGYDCTCAGNPRCQKEERNE